MGAKAKSIHGLWLTPKGMRVNSGNARQWIRQWIRQRVALDIPKISKEAVEVFFICNRAKIIKRNIIADIYYFYFTWKRKLKGSEVL